MARNAASVILRHERSIRFLWEGRRQVPGPQSRFDMTDRHARIKGRQRGRQTGGRIALHQHDIRPFLVQDIPHRQQHAGCDVEKILSRLHYIEIVVRNDFEQSQHLIQHLAMLPAGANCAVNARRIPQAQDDRRKLDSFRSGSHDAEDPDCHQRMTPRVSMTTLSPMSSGRRDRNSL